MQGYLKQTVSSLRGLPEYSKTSPSLLNSIVQVGLQIRSFLMKGDSLCTASACTLAFSSFIFLIWLIERVRAEVSKDGLANGLRHRLIIKYLYMTIQNDNQVDTKILSSTATLNEVNTRNTLSASPLVAYYQRQCWQVFSISLYNPTQLLMSSLQSVVVTRWIKKYMELTKFKLSVLNGIVTIASYSMYSTPVSALPLFLSSVALSMSTQTLNQYMEVEYDKKMKRTCQRPLVLGLNPYYALANGILLGTGGMLGLYSYYGAMTAGLGAVIWGGYLFGYTKMKTRSEWNTMLGSVVGSLPVYLGWIASGRSYCMIEPFAMFIYMMAWQHQHFYGIRWIYYDDYNNAGFKMEKNKQIAAAHVISQTVLTLLFTNYALKYYNIPYCLLFNGILSAGLYFWGIKPSFKFAQGKLSPKQFKMQSYKHFCLVFGIFMLCKYLGEEPEEKSRTARRYPSSENQGIFDVLC